MEKWHWTDVKQKAFDTMKKITSRETLLACPNFDKEVEIHTDASHTQLGAITSQNGKPVAFHSRKLNPAQACYTTTEWELLAIVDSIEGTPQYPDWTERSKCIQITRI